MMLNLEDFLSAATFTPRHLSFPDAWVGHIPFAHWLIRTIRPALFVELGTHTGNSYFAFCQSVAETKLSTQCYAVDTWRGDEHAGFYGEEVFEYVQSINETHYAAFSRLMRMTFDEAASYFSEGSINLLHIDGLHTYEAVRHDFETWYPKVAEGGIILFHDVSVRERGFGVWRLWEELIQNYPYHALFGHSNSLGVLLKLPATEKIPKSLTWLVPNSSQKKRLAEIFSALGQRILWQYQVQEQKRTIDDLHKDLQMATGKAQRYFSQWKAEEEKAQRYFSQWKAEEEKAQRYFSQWKAEEENRVKVQQILEQILNSRSWRVTRPIRFVARVVRHIFHSNINGLKGEVRLLLHRFPWVDDLWTRACGWISAFHQRVKDLSECNNLAAWQFLSRERLNPYAVVTSFPVAAPNDWPEIDMSLVTYQSSSWLNQWFTSLVQQKYPLSKIHLFVVDHGSTDSTLEYLVLASWQNRLKDRLRGFTLIKQKNLGFGIGHDTAIRCGSAPFCLVTNPDLEFIPDSICYAVRVALADDKGEVACWEFRQIPYEHPKHYDPVTLETAWCSHSCILLRRSAYEKSGGYDPKLFLYVEDVEFSYRLRTFGYRLKYVPQAVVRHYSYQTAGELKRWQSVGSIVGNTLIRWRYFGWRERLIGVFLAFSLILRIILQFETRRDLLNAIKHYLRHGLSARPIGSVTVPLPIRGLDYEIARPGAFWESRLLKSTEIEPTPLITVVVRTFAGRDQHLRNALVTLLHQTYPAIEILIAEDGSGNASRVVDKIACYTPEGVHIRHIPCPKIGRSAVANVALAQARGTYLLVFDDDDLLYADHLETLYSAIRATGAPAAYSLAFELPSDCSNLNAGCTEHLPTLPNILVQPWDYDVLTDHNFLPVQSVLFARHLYETYGGFDAELDQLEDWNLWLRYGKNHTFAYVPKVTSLFRTPSDPHVRALRQLRLHQAYHKARERAGRSSPNFGVKIPLGRST